MPKYVIEREVPGIGAQSDDAFHQTAQTSCGVLKELGPQIQWIESFVTDDKVYCVYLAPNEAIIRAHAEKGGFPCNSVREVKRIIDPTTAE